MEPLDLFSVVLRAAAFVAALQAAGLTWFVASCRRAEVAAVPSVSGLLRISALFALVLVLTHRALDAGRLAGEWSGILDPHLHSMVWSRRPGLSSVVCAVGLLTMMISTGRSMRWGGRVGSVAALGVVGSFALTGHTTEASHAGWLQGLVALHVGLAAYWIGGVAGLYRLTRQSGTAAVARAAAGFSATAVWLVPLILPAGVLLIWGLLPNLAALRTVYGGFLLAKAIGLGCLILLAARNRLRSLPALAADALGAVQSFQRVLCAEYVLLCGVLAATATMTSLFSWH
jgi:putative copper resistance protein D